MELLEKLGINWSLLVAQVVNFAILLGLLSFFIYRPFLNLLDSRSERIRKAMEEAKKIERQNKEFEDIREKALAKIDAECGTYMEKLRTEAEAARETMFLDAKRETEEMIAKAKREIEREREKVTAEILGKLTGVVIAVAEKVLQREFSPGDEQRLVASIEKDLPALVR